MGIMAIHTNVFPQKISSPNILNNHHYQSSVIPSDSGYSNDSFVPLSVVPVSNSPFFPLYFGSDPKPTDPRFFSFISRTETKIHTIAKSTGGDNIAHCRQLAILAQQITGRRAQLPPGDTSLQSRFDSLSEELQQAWRKQVNLISSKEAADLLAEYKPLLYPEMASTLRDRIMRRPGPGLLQSQYAGPLDKAVSQWFKHNTDTAAVELGNMYGQILLDQQEAEEFPPHQRKFWQDALSGLISDKRADFAWNDVINQITPEQAAKMLMQLFIYQDTVVYTSLLEKAGISINA